MSTTSETAGNNTIVEIERLALPWTMEAQYPIANLEAAKRVQVRELKHYAPRENVVTFSAQMAAGVAFPPIVVTRDGWLVDGNTRVGARLERKDPFTPAIVIGIDYNGATEKHHGYLIALAATLNSQGGQRLAQAEIREAAAVLIKLGWKADQIGRAIGMKSSSITGVKQEVEAVARLTRVGVPETAIKGASLRALGSTAALALNDLPYKELAELSIDAGFNALEIRSHATAARETGSDQEGIALIRALRVECGDRIAERKLTGGSKPPMSRQLRQHLGFITKFAGREQELLETDPNVGAKHIETLSIALKVLTEVERLQVS